MSELSSDPPIRSFSQNAEDIRLWRVFQDRESGFYVDVGAGHPSNGSVTRLFYEQGWTGINIEPGPMYPYLEKARPRDLNLRMAVSLQGGMIDFHVTYPDVNLSTLDPQILEWSRDKIEHVEIIKVPVRPLEEILVEHAAGRRIDFLKIDAEGAETAIIESTNLKRFRPSVIVVESIMPWSHDSSHEEWETILTGNDYLFVTFDGINRFYVSRESEPLAGKLAYPISVLDNFIPPSEQLALEQVTSKERELQSWKAEWERSFGDVAALRREVEQVTARAHNAEARLQSVIASRSYRMATMVRRVTSPARPLYHPGIRLLRKGKKISGAARRRIHQAPHPLTSAIILNRYRQALSPGRAFTFPLPGEMEPRQAKSDGPLSKIRAVLERYHFRSDLPVDDLAKAIDATKHHEEALLVAQQLEVGIRDAIIQAEMIGILQEQPAASAASIRQEKEKNLAVIDVRCLQDPRFRHRGIGRHAEHVLRSTAAMLNGKMEIVLLTDPSLPRLDEGLEILGSRRVASIGGDDLHQTGLFIELSPMTASPGLVLSLLLAQWIRCATVIYDFIPAEHEALYLNSDESWISYQARLEALSKYDAFLAISEATAAAFNRFMGENISVKVTGVANPLAIPENVLEGSEGEQRPFSRYILVASGADPRKNPLSAIAAQAARSGLRQRTGTVIVGHFPETMMAAVNEFVIDCGLGSGQVKICSQLTNGQLQSLYAGADLVVVPSFAEGFSIPVVEAINSGTPVIASDIDAHRELLGEGWWLVPPDDPIALGKSMARAQRNPAELLNHQREVLGRRFEAGAVGARVREALDSVLSHGEVEYAPKCAPH